MTLDEYPKLFVIRLPLMLVGIVLLRGISLR